MRIGWIGAGKVGFSLGRYFTEHGISVSGYYSSNPQSAKEAAEFTGTRFYERLEDLVWDSEVIFLTVPDGAITAVWEQLKQLQIQKRVICHCSGVLSSKIFSDITAYECSGFSIHPLLAISSKRNSYLELSNALFTIEGQGEAFLCLTDMLRSCGNQVISLQQEEKVRYHAAAVLASNLVLALAETAIEELMQCGFSRKEAQGALGPFMQANAAHLMTQSLEESLTGPIERGDADTVEKHLEVLEGKNKMIYGLLSQKALMIAERKNPGRDYKSIYLLLSEHCGKK